MHESEALAQLLTNSRARQEFRKNPAAWPQVADLNSDEIEAQAQVLLNKRLHSISWVIPKTMKAASPMFHRYAEAHWPKDITNPRQDAWDFLLYLRRYQPALIDALENHRLDFKQQGRKLSLRFFWRYEINNLKRPVLHVLTRKSDFYLYF